jgi:hypothetical protein
MALFTENLRTERGATNREMVERIDKMQKLKETPEGSFLLSP